MLKYILILFVIVIGYMIVTKDNGGSGKAGSNYAKVRGIGGWYKV